MVAHQIHKNYRPKVFGANTPLLFAHAYKALCARFGPYGNKHYAALVKLLNKGTWHFWPAGCYNYAIKWRGLWHTEGAITPLHVDLTAHSAQDVVSDWLNSVGVGTQW